MSMKNWRAIVGGHEFKVVRFNDSPPVGAVLDKPENIVSYLVPQLAESVLFRPDVENLIVIHLSTRYQPIGYEVISNGVLDTLLIHPREIFKSAILANSASIVLAHNHPSGDPSPSEPDIKATRDLIRASKLMKIELLDHIILGSATPERVKDYASLRELGYFYI